MNETTRFFRARPSGVVLRRFRGKLNISKRKSKGYGIAKQRNCNERLKNDEKNTFLTVKSVRSCTKVCNDRGCHFIGVAQSGKEKRLGYESTSGSLDIFRCELCVQNLAASVSLIS